MQQRWKYPWPKWGESGRKMLFFLLLSPFSHGGHNHNHSPIQNDSTLLWTPPTHSTHYRTQNNFTERFGRTHNFGWLFSYESMKILCATRGPKRDRESVSLDIIVQRWWMRRRLLPKSLQYKVFEDEGHSRNSHHHLEHALTDYWAAGTGRHKTTHEDNDDDGLHNQPEWNGKILHFYCPQRMRAAPTCQNDVFSMNCSARMRHFPNPIRSAAARGHEPREWAPNEWIGGRESTLLSRNLSMRTNERSGDLGWEVGREKTRREGNGFITSAAGLRIFVGVEYVLGKRVENWDEWSSNKYSSTKGRKLSWNHGAFCSFIPYWEQILILLFSIG